jgi:pimeloyl-ACP methyl ester carboxylesterase
MTRHARTLITLIALSATTALAGACGDDEPRDTYVLVHGAWMGAWAWDAVADELRATGAEVAVVELPAHGQDDTPVAELGMNLYVDRVVETLDAKDRPVILVGHSMGGMVIAQAAEARPERIRTLVFASAYLPRSGQSLLDLAYQDADAITGHHLVDHGDGTVGIEAEALAEVFCHDCEPDMLSELEEHYRAEPGMPLGEPVSLTEARFGSVPRVYIETTDDRAVSLSLQRQMVAATPVGRVISLATSHAPMLADPAAFASALLSL